MYVVVWCEGTEDRERTVGATGGEMFLVHISAYPSFNRCLSHCLTEMSSVLVNCSYVVSLPTVLLPLFPGWHTSVALEKNILLLPGFCEVLNDASAVIP